MIWTNERRKKLISWLIKNGPKEYYSALKTQKFLFFFESFSKINNQDYDFSKLKAYKNGPVFSEVYGDYKYNFEELTEESSKMTLDNIDTITAKKAHFLTQIMNNDELSTLTHQFDMWRTHESEIENGVLQIEMKEKDFTHSDCELAQELFDLYDISFVDRSEVLIVGDKHFLFTKKDFASLNETQKSTLEKIALEEDLINPVYVEIGNEGDLIID
nr:MAG TPA: hypothetical protein [Caudoviricetes sp.]